MNWLSNGWVVGIGGGVISSVIVYFITNFFVSKKENKIYKEKTNIANTEILHSLKPMITNYETITEEYYVSVTNAISIKYNVDVRDLHKFEIVMDIIITEIMQSQFLNYDLKKKYCENIYNIKTKKEIDKIKINNLSQEKLIVRTSSISTKYFSLVISLMTVMFSFVFVVTLSLENPSSLFLSSRNFNEGLLYLSTFIMIPISSMIIIQILFIIRKSKQHQNNQNEKIKDNKTEDTNN